MKEFSKRENGGKRLFTTTTTTAQNTSKSDDSSSINDFYLNTNLNTIESAANTTAPTKHFTYTSITSPSAVTNTKSFFDSNFTDNGFKFETKNTNNKITFDSLNDDIWNIKNVNLKIPLTMSTAATAQNAIFTNKSRYNNTFFKTADSKINNNNVVNLNPSITTEWNRQLPTSNMNTTRNNVQNNNNSSTMKQQTTKRFDDDFDF